MIIETKRLSLIPLTPEQLYLWVNDIEQLENEIQCKYRAEPMTGIFKEIVSGQLKETQKDAGQYVWHTFWFIMRNTDNAIIGSADFKDIPDEYGNVEIGYGLGKEFEHCGYMTEAVTAMCEWAQNQPGVKAIVAETELDGYASQKILTKCGFREYKRDTTVWWKLS